MLKYDKKLVSRQCIFDYFYKYFHFFTTFLLTLIDNIEKKSVFLHRFLDKHLLI